MARGRKNPCFCGAPPHTPPGLPPWTCGPSECGEMRLIFTRCEKLGKIVNQHFCWKLTNKRGLNSFCIRLQRKMLLKTHREKSWAIEKFLGNARTIVGNL